MAKPIVKSVVAIARMLNAEGFTPHIASCVRRYARREMTVYQRRRYGKAKAMFSAMVKEKLDDRDRLVLGRYISHIAGANLNVGIRIGLGARIALAEED